MGLGTWLGGLGLTGSRGLVYCLHQFVGPFASALPFPKISEVPFL